MFAGVKNLFDRNGDPDNEDAEEKDNDHYSSESHESSSAMLPAGDLIFRLEGVGTFPVVSFDYVISFGEYPSIKCAEGKPKFSFIFPSSIEQLAASKRMLDIRSYEKEKLRAISSLDVTDLISALCKELQSSRKKFPISREISNSIDLKNENSELMGAIKLKLTLSCMGPIYVTDIVSKERGNSQISNSSRQSILSETSIGSKELEPKYDEFCAVVNGHNLRIRMLKNTTSKSRRATSDTGRHESLKSKDSLRKPTKFQVNDCKEDDHCHLNTTVNVTDDGAPPDSKEDNFTIVIGKRNEHDKGRLEINLKAPKPLQAEDFKQPTRSAQTQTDTAVEEPRKKGKKPARK